MRELEHEFLSNTHIRSRDQCGDDDNILALNTVIDKSFFIDTFDVTLCVYLARKLQDNQALNLSL